MKTSTYLSSYVRCEIRKSSTVGLRPKGLFGIGVESDAWALEWQRLDRIGYKCSTKIRVRLEAVDALAEKAWEDDSLMKLFDAVDDYLYGQVAGEGYPEGHVNPGHLSALREAFLDV